ncbi:SDR family NAD(P)-dependent oxidoreductase [Sphingobium tyrosinilyticum]|uniref:SDR family NAD(P)-dependent oxidoreductase n=1 Tax=Sphingobium tyrosinilyticum TaxID=2715436 RepID=A0ABV9F1N7_9SPHN
MSGTPPILLVTGATGAIGGEIAAQAAESGRRIAVHGRSEDSVASAIDQLRLRCPEASLFPAPADFDRPDAITKLIDGLAAAGPIGSVIHCAVSGAPGVTGGFPTTNPSAFAVLADATLARFQQLCFAALPHLAIQGGTIVTLAADSGRFAAPNQSLLAGAYGGMMSFVRSLALEVAHHGVRVHCLSPSFVEGTPIFDAFAGSGSRAESARNRAGLGLPQPKDIAPIALFLCGPGAAKITGQIISINGGLNA